MRFKDSPYYNEKLLGKNLYERFIIDNAKIFTVKEFFNINSEQKQYKKEIQYKSLYVLKIYDEYYELYSYDDINYGYIVFDNPVHITGKYCKQIIAPEIIVKRSMNNALVLSIANKVIVNNDSFHPYEINFSKIKNIYYYNKKLSFYKSEVDNFFIFNEELFFNDFTTLSDRYKVKFFGRCKYLKEKILNNKKFQNGIIHIE